MSGGQQDALAGGAPAAPPSSAKLPSQDGIAHAPSSPLNVPQARARQKHTRRLTGWRRCLSIRTVLALVAVVQVAGGIAFSWGLTYSLAFRNSELLVEGLLKGVREQTRIQVEHHLALAQQLVQRNIAELEAARIVVDRPAAAWQALKQNLDIYPTVLSNYVYWNATTLYGVMRCQTSEAICPFGFQSYVVNGSTTTIYAADARGQPFKIASGPAPFRIRPTDWYALTMASPSNATWSSIRMSNNPLADPLNNLMVTYSAVFRAPVPDAAAPAPDPTSPVAPWGPRLGAAGVNVNVGALSGVLAGLVQVPDSVVFLATDAGRLVASSTLRFADVYNASGNAALTLESTPSAALRDLARTADADVAAAATGRAVARSEGRGYFIIRDEVAMAPDLRWRLYVGVPRDALLAQLQESTTWTAVANSLWLALCVVASAGIAWGITRPLAELRASIRALVETMTRTTREMKRETQLQRAGEGPLPGAATVPLNAPESGVALPSLASVAAEPAPAARRRLSSLLARLRGSRGSVAPARPFVRHGSAATNASGGSELEEPSGASSPGSPENPLAASLRTRQALALSSGLAELTAFENVVGDLHTRVLAFREFSSTETSLLKTLLAERKTKLEIEVRSEETRKFLATMSHEMRTPLNGILGMLQLARECELPSDAFEYVEAASLSGEHLLSLVNDVLDLQKIEAGAIELQSVPMSVRAAAQTAVKIVQQKATDKGLRLGVTLDERLPALVAGDPDRLRQVLLNLVGNAVKYTAAGEVRVRVLVREGAAAPPGHVSVLFEIEDTGPGIDADSQAQLFTRFFRVRRLPGGAPDPGGTGLGLAISREIVLRAGGDIGCSSEVGRGSRFYFHIPFRLVEAAAVEAAGGGREGPRSSASIGAGSPPASQPASHAPSSLALYAGPDSPPPGGTPPAPRPPLPAGLGYLGSAGLSSLSPQLALDPSAAPDGAASGRIAGALPSPRDSNMSSATLAREMEVARGRVSFSSRLSEGGSDSLRPAGSLRARPAGRPLSILVVEDNAVNARVLTSMLTREGHAVTVAEDGARALEAIRAALDAAQAAAGPAARAFDVIFMDCLMPVLNGYEATRALRRLEQERGVPRHFVVALTANATAEDEALCLRAGMDEYLSKPLRKPLLLAKIERLREEGGREAAAPGPPSPALSAASAAPAGPPAPRDPSLRSLPDLARPPISPRSPPRRPLSSLGALGEAGPKKAAGRGRAAGERLQILVVDDVEMNRRVLCAFLANDGHEVATAVDGADALAQFELRARRLAAERPGELATLQVFDLVFMDVAMPRLDGHGASRAIRALERELGLGTPTPIVACTAFSSAHDRAGAASSGMSDFISKPVARDLLLGVLARWAPRRASSGASGGPPPATPEARPEGGAAVSLAAPPDLLLP